MIIYEFGVTVNLSLFVFHWWL